MQYTDKMRSYPMDSAAFRNFMFQGKALFTIKNSEGNEITLSVKSLPRRRKDPENRELFNVELKSVDGVYQRSRFIGQVNRTERKFVKSTYIDDDNPGVEMMNWIINNWSNLEDFKETSFYHRGRCAKCSKELLLPESIENGIGPQCIKYRERQTFEIIKELGITTKGLSYTEMVLKAIEKDPSVYSKVFIPDSVRRDMNRSIFEDIFDDVLF